MKAYKLTVFTVILKGILCIACLLCITNCAAQTDSCYAQDRSWLNRKFCNCDNIIPDSFLSEGYLEAAKIKAFDIRFVGNGNIQKTFETGEGIPANTGIGLSLTKYFVRRKSKTFGGFYKIEVEASINIASTLDTLTAKGITNKSSGRMVSNPRDFGTAVLTPLNSGQAVNLEVTGYRRCTAFGLISGYKARYTGSNRNWQLNPDTIVQATSNLFRVGIFHDAVPYKYRSEYSMLFGVAFAVNSISGDIGQKENAALRKIFLGTEKKTFYGLDLTMGFRLKNIRAEFNYLIFPSSQSIPGLTGGRIVTTIGFVGGFPISLN